MSKSGAKSSELAVENSESPSVYDFLYNDARRVASFLSQFEGGHLQQLTKSDRITKGSKRGWSARIGGDVPLLGGLSGEVGLEPGESGSEASERVYDPYWSNASALLNHLSEHDLVGRDIGKAAIGRIVLVSGGLNIIDLGMLREAWKLPSVRQAAMAGAANNVDNSGESRQVRRSRDNHKGGHIAKPQMPSEAELLLEFLTILPHSLNALITSSHGNAWCNLKEEYLVGSGSDLVLKHGLVVPGAWNMLGVLDAKPDVEAFTNFLGLGDDHPALLLFNNLIGNLSNKLVPTFRLLLGRPSSSYGVTPLLIFRQVS